MGEGVEIQKNSPHLRLNIGCGEFPAKGWINMDIHTAGPRPDILGTIFDIPLPGESCKQVYCGHVLEHIPKEEVKSALEEVRRVLRPDGELLIVGPDRLRTKPHDHVLRRTIARGGRRWPGDEHQWVSTERAMRDLLTDWAYTPISISKVPRKWPVVSRAYWQFAILCYPR